MNAPLQIKVKGVFTVKLLNKLIKETDKYCNGCVFKALFLVAFYGFFRDIVGDIVWGNPGVHLIVACFRPISSSSVAKNTGQGPLSSYSIKNYLEKVLKELLCFKSKQNWE